MLLLVRRRFRDWKDHLAPATASPPVARGIMLLRTASAPVLNTLAAAHPDSTPPRPAASSSLYLLPRGHRDLCIATREKRTLRPPPPSRPGGGGDGGRSLDVYYQRMIGAYPADALLLSNYANFLKEARGEAEKAEEYCERAILAEAGDGNLLSMYGDLIWRNHRDGPRARSYFNRAVQCSPDDCYVLASYANFLWDAGEDG